jgi:hypothetical protein
LLKVNPGNLFAEGARSAVDGLGRLVKISLVSLEVDQVASVPGISTPFRRRRVRRSRRLSFDMRSRARGM